MQVQYWILAQNVLGYYAKSVSTTPLVLSNDLPTR